MTKQVKKLQAALNECDITSAAMETIEAQLESPYYQAHPEEFDRLDDRWDILYQAHFKAFTQAASTIYDLLGGKIDPKTIRTMVITQRDRLTALLSRAA